VKLKSLKKTTILKVIEQCISEHKEIEIINWSIPESPYITGTCFYTGIIISGLNCFEFHYSTFHKIFPKIFVIQSMSNIEYDFWRALMALCFLKGFNIKLRTRNNVLSVIEIENGHYLSLNFEVSSDDNSIIQQIIGYDEVNGYSAKYFCYEHFLNQFILPLLNQEAQEFGIPFKAIDDLTDDNLLILSAFTL